MMDMHMRADEINNIKHPTQKILLSRYVYILCVCIVQKLTETDNKVALHDTHPTHNQKRRLFYYSAMYSGF